MQLLRTVQDWVAPALVWTVVAMLLALLVTAVINTAY
jgi:hypothetical protein